MHDSTIPPIRKERERRLSLLQLDKEILVENRLKWVTWARIGILALLAVTTLSAFRDTGTPTPLILLASSAFALLLNGIYLIWLRSRRALTLLGSLQISGDLVLWCIVIYCTGGASSAFSVLFHLTVIVGAFLYGSRGAVFAALASAALYSALSVIMYLHVIAPPADMAALPTIEPREMIYFTIVNIAGLTLVGALAGHLAERERRAGGKLEEAKKVSADLAALNDDIVRSLTVGLAATDLTGSILWMSPAGAEILGTRPSKLVGEPIADLIPIQEPLPPPHVITGEPLLEREEERSISLAYRLTPLVDGDGDIKGSLLSFQNQTQLIRMQAKVERAERLAALG